MRSPSSPTTSELNSISLCPLLPNVAFSLCHSSADTLCLQCASHSQKKPTQPKMDLREIEFSSLDGRDDGKHNGVDFVKLFFISAIQGALLFGTISLNRL